MEGALNFRKHFFEFNKYPIFHIGSNIQITQAALNPNYFMTLLVDACAYPR